MLEAVYENTSSFWIPVQDLVAGLESNASDSQSVTVAEFPVQRGYVPSRNPRPTPALQENNPSSYHVNAGALLSSAVSAWKGISDWVTTRFQQTADYVVGASSAALVFFAEPGQSPQTVGTPTVVLPQQSATTSTDSINSPQASLGQATVVNQYITQPVIERVVQTVAAPNSAGFVTQTEFTNQLNALSNTFNKTMYGTTYPAPATNYASGGVFNSIALSNKIDNLSGTKLSSITVNGVSGLTDADIPDGVTASNYLALTGGTLSGDLTLAGNLTVSGAQTLSGAITVPYITATSTVTASSFQQLLVNASTTLQNFTFVNATGTSATTTNMFSTLGRFTTGIIDSLTATAATISNLIATTIIGTNATFTNATTTNATSTNVFAASLTATNGAFTNATSTSFFATTASSTNLFTSLFNAGGSALVVSSTGNVGTGTSTPWTKLSVLDTVGSAQFTLAYDATRYSQMYVDASGDLTLSSTGGNVRLPDYNLLVCSGSACPAPTFSISGTGNLQIENRLIAGSIEQTCPSGYVWVTGSAKYGTLPGFCTMKYEAKNDGSNNAVSTAAGSPWVSISQVTARAQCEALGAGYHLISEPEWMTIATQISTLPINDLDSDAGLQLANGHTDNSPASSLASTAGADPAVSGCNLMLTLEDASNAYVSSSCELRGTGAGGSTDSDKGYYGTGQQWSATGYSSGAANKAQLRTAVLQNGNVIWDIPGNVWEWTDAYIYSALGSGAASTTSEMPDAGSWSASGWFDWTQITNFKSLGYIRPKVTTWSAASNGIGRIYLDADVASDGTNYHAFLRGGGWDAASHAGVFALGLDYGPAGTGARLGFRCSR